MKNMKKWSIYFFIVHKSNRFTYSQVFCWTSKPPSDKISSMGIKKLSSKISRYYLISRQGINLTNNKSQLLNLKHFIIHQDSVRTFFDIPQVTQCNKPSKISHIQVSVRELFEINNVDSTSRTWQSVNRKFLTCFPKRFLVNAHNLHQFTNILYLMSIA